MYKDSHRWECSSEGGGGGTCAGSRGCRGLEYGCLGSRALSVARSTIITRCWWYLTNTYVDEGRYLVLFVWCVHLRVVRLKEIGREHCQQINGLLGQNCVLSYSGIRGAATGLVAGLPGATGLVLGEWAFLSVLVTVNLSDLERCG